MNGDANGGGGSLPEIELIIKASAIDGKRKGADIFCQEYFMDLYLLAELKTISLKITTVDMKRPPADFRSNFEAAQPPILIDNGVAILENDKIERHIMKAVPGGHNLFVPDSEVSRKIENLYNRFKVMLIKRDEASKNRVTAILKSIDEELAKKKTRFLTGDTLCCFDTELMPKLQHVRHPQVHRRGARQEEDAFSYRRHPVLLRHGADAEAAARPPRRQVLPRLRDPARVRAPVALHQGDVPTRRLRTELPRRPGHHPDVQDAADARGDAVAPDGEQGGAGEAFIHHDGAFEHRLVNVFAYSAMLRA